MSTRTLEGKVAVVAGATRGAGRGIARGLGEAGAVVYCTGRSVRGWPSPYGRPETIEETAEMVSAMGGTGLAVRVDHSVEAEVEALFARVAAEHGRLDVLVSCVAGEDPLLAGHEPIWKADLSRAPDVFRQTVATHLITAKHAARPMIKQKRGLIVEVSEGDFLLGGVTVVHALVKTALKTIAVQLAEELRPHGVAALAITPGFLRSESMLEHFGVTPESWREGGRKDPHFLQSESPLFIGRAVAALASDPEVLAQSGDITSSWELARRYGITDEDGTRPDWGRHSHDVVFPTIEWVRESQRRQLALMQRLVRRAEDYLDAGLATAAP